jgi:hypothetical protein
MYLIAGLGLLWARRRTMARGEVESAPTKVEAATSRPI